MGTAPDREHDALTSRLLADAGRVLTPRRLCRLREAASARLSGLAVGFDSLHDPHNVSAALRSCDAFGVQNIHLASSEAGAPTSRGITKGCERWLTFHWHESPRACADALRQQGFRVLLAMPGEGSPPIGQVDFSAKTALVFGNEHAGVSPEFVGVADGRFHIPMVGFVESLNVSVAVAVSVFHAASARRKALGAKTDMPPAERDALLARWLRRELDARKGFGC